ncbi:helix-turn-helix transcriptional regulator [Paenibacillus arenilitoris]|uniref:Helix-turn-helix transcriptional regulator n=1 Tax=Paenibacillus arenilitoris TaxID=2772299 RepID=A0A927CGF3_9BACL|nr:AraC family transcriptional regulator [Paenibacillus arenilitoris]MBD2867090.1 helix-turn-helix transcriptional regulator [Paenibacillus arenilitoris]
MNDRHHPKYHIGEHDFSIQYMSRNGSSSMPRPHEHPFFELYYLLNGERVYFMDDKVFTVRKGDLMIVRPHDLHSTASTDKPTFERILVGFSRSFIEQGDAGVAGLLNDATSRLIRIPLKDQPEIERLLRAMLEECKSEQTHYGSLVRSCMNELLIRLRRIESALQSQASHEYEHPMHQKITEIAQYIKTYYREKLTLEQVAGQFYISPSYLSRIFTKLTGFHFREYVQVVRIREAQKMLASGRESVQLVSEQTGFEHIAHFNKTFKKIAGTTPLRYRKQNEQA